MPVAQAVVPQLDTSLRLWDTVLFPLVTAPGHRGEPDSCHHVHGRNLFKMVESLTDLYRIGCAGWSLPRNCRASFPQAGSQLQRYATRFNAVEINSSFYRLHRTTTYERWADSTPDDFRFAAKVLRQITHRARLRDVRQELDEFLDTVAGLGPKLAVLLVQLPPSLPLEQDHAETFFAQLTAQCKTTVVCEPRHPSWFSPEAEQLLAGFGVARVLADPSVVPEAVTPRGSAEITYLRLHGQPKMYYSPYSADQLTAFAEQMVAYRQRSAEIWCIFDNTALGAAPDNALSLMAMLDQRCRQETLAIGQA
jgi:uncharacterized protein YecE (DUF72 family)